MKKVILLFIISLVSFRAISQRLSAPMETAIAACEHVSKAYGSSGIATFNAALKEFQKANIEVFNDISFVKGQNVSLDGHLIFDEQYLSDVKDSGKLIYLAQKYQDRRCTRSPKSTDKVRLTTKALKKGGKGTWKTSKRGVAEFALVAEPKGLFTVTIRDAKGNVLYAETNKNKVGAAVRRIRIKLPENKGTTLYIEVVNYSNTDASFALLKY